MEKKKLLIGLILFLLVLNLTTIGTVMVYLRKSASPVPNPVPVEQKLEPVEGVAETQRAGYMAKQLGLSAPQQEQFRASTQTYNQEARKISSAMQGLRDQLLDEMNDVAPDTSRLDELSRQIGSLHIELKKHTVRYYLQLKDICTTDQRVELYRMFKNLLGPESEVAPGRGIGPPSDRARGRGQQGHGPGWRGNRDSTRI